MLPFLLIFLQFHSFAQLIHPIAIKVFVYYTNVQNINRLQYWYTLNILNIKKQ